MAGVFYTHRLLKMLDELVVDAGLTVTISDAGTDVDLSQQHAMIEHSLKAKGVSVAVQPMDGATMMTFSRR
ncbi:MAG: hypothetical protein AAFV69_02260 [Pseudomonadota bacterium]